MLLAYHRLTDMAVYIVLLIFPLVIKRLRGLLYMLLLVMVFLDTI